MRTSVDGPLGHRAPAFSNLRSALTLAARRVQWINASDTVSAFFTNDTYKVGRSGGGLGKRYLDSTG